MTEIINSDEEKKDMNCHSMVILMVFFSESVFLFCFLFPEFFGWKLVYFISILTIVIDILIAIYFTQLFAELKFQDKTVLNYDKSWIIILIIVVGVFHNVQGARYISDMVTGPIVVESSSYRYGKNELQLYEEKGDNGFHVTSFWFKDWREWRFKETDSRIEVTYYPKTLLLKGIKVIDE